MFINATGFYVPEERVDNQHFLELNGLTSEWIEQRTGIRSRSKAKAEENINTMSMEAVRNALPKLPYDITDVDLIVSASYSPYDTVATAAHLAQHEFHIENAKALYLSSACSSFLNALEVVEGYLPEGRDVFIQACTYMPKNVLYLLEKNGYTLDNLTYFIGHQANMRIMSNIAKQLNLPEEKFLHNIEELGNTGSVSSALVYAQNDHSFKKGDLVAITVFGGGYSTGACLIKC